VSAAGYEGEWAEIDNGYQFRAKDAARLNWFPKTGTVQYQGPKDSAKKLQDSLAEVHDSPSVRQPVRSSRSFTAAVPEQTSRIFVVHGHDDLAREQLELILHKLGLQPYVLASTGGSGLTIIEALEREIVERRSRCDFGIVLMTPDDRGYAECDGARAIQSRPRQNVVLEMGMMLAALGRHRVIVLRKGHLEAPSDAAGIIYIPFNHHVRETVPRLVDRLREAGFELEGDAITRASS
jgi:predicted nucleotide-binding protein